MLKEDNEVFISKVYENISNSIDQQFSGKYISTIKVTLESKLHKSNNDLNTYCTSLLNNIVYFRELSMMYTTTFLSYVFHGFPSSTEYERQSAFLEQTVKEDVGSKSKEYLNEYSKKCSNMLQLRELLEFDYMYYSTIYQLAQSFVGALVDGQKGAVKYISSLKNEKPVELQEAFLRYNQLYTNGLIKNIK